MSKLSIFTHTHKHQDGLLVSASLDVLQLRMLRRIPRSVPETPHSRHVTVENDRQAGVGSHRKLLEARDGHDTVLAAAVTSVLPSESTPSKCFSLVVIAVVITWVTPLAEGEPSSSVEVF